MRECADVPTGVNFARKVTRRTAARVIVEVVVAEAAAAIKGCAL